MTHDSQTDGYLKFIKGSLRNKKYINKSKSIVWYETIDPTYGKNGKCMQALDENEKVLMTVDSKKFFDEDLITISNALGWTVVDISRDNS